MQQGADARRGSSVAEIRDGAETAGDIGEPAVDGQQRAVARLGENAVDPREIAFGDDEGLLAQMAGGDPGHHQDRNDQRNPRGNQQGDRTDSRHFLDAARHQHGARRQIRGHFRGSEHSQHS